MFKQFNSQQDFFRCKVANLSCSKDKTNKNNTTTLKPLRFIQAMVIVLLSFPLLLDVFAEFRPITSLETKEIKKIIISPKDSRIIIIAAKKAVFKSNDKTKSFIKLVSFIEEDIQNIFAVSSILYIITSRNIYKFTDSGLEKIKSVLSEEEIITSSAINQDDFYIGTSLGLYMSKLKEIFWQSPPSLAQAGILAIDSYKNNTYFSSQSAIYRLTFDGKREKILSLPNNASEELESDNFFIQTIKIDRFKEDKIWLGTNKGLYLLDSKSRTWDKLLFSGLDHLSITVLYQLSNNIFYLGTKAGVYKLELKSQEIKPLDLNFSGEVSDIAINKNGKVYIASKDGLWWFAINKKNILAKNEATYDYIEIDPSIEDLQLAALKYNEVGPEKIKAWRNSLKYRALLPQVRLGYDRNIYGGYGATYQGYFIGPVDWSVSLAWELGDLIWNTHENEVDMRSKLNTQLRLDILEEVNRLYFQRVRLRDQLKTLKDKETRNNYQLRLQELAASLDAYTGGYFSKKLRQLNQVKGIRKISNYE